MLKNQPFFKDHIPYTEYIMVQIKDSINQVKTSADIKVLKSYIQP